MILSSAGLALGDILSAPFRAVLWKSLGLTALVLIVLWFGAEAGFSSGVLPTLSAYLPALPSWTDGAGTLASWIAGIVIAVALAYLIGPISAVIAGLFLDDVAEAVERTHYAAEPRGRAMPFWRGVLHSLTFFGIVIAGNLLALMLLLVPGVNLAAFFVVNGYLLGREYFEFAALRFREEAEARALRRRHRGTIFLAGLLVAGFMAIPFVNLLTPLFAAALMVHLHRGVAAREAKSSAG